MNLLKYFTLLNIVLLDSVKDFLSSLTLIDVVFFFSVILLMILLVVLLYFIKVNEDDSKNEIISNIENNTLSDTTYNVSDETIVEEIKSDDEVSSVQTIEAGTNNFEDYDDEEGELLDLATITKRLENKELNDIDLSKFEEEQEKEAIISYEELVNKAKKSGINYKKETMIDDVSVKEVDVDNLFVQDNENTYNVNAVDSIGAISYAQEEAFLKALKQLQQQIN